jgi:hypothetical protein
MPLARMASPEDGTARPRAMAPTPETMTDLAATLILAGIRILGDLLDMLARWRNNDDDRHRTGGNGLRGDT